MTDEAVGACGICGAEDRSPLGAPRFRQTEVHVVRRVQAEPRVPVFGVVPAKEIDAVQARVFERAKALGKVGPILQRLEVCS